jgi:HSP20 family protein
MKKEGIELSLHEDVLTVSGERKAEFNGGATLYRAERFTGRFSRAVSLPTRVVADKVQASYKDGILTVTLPKAEEAKARQIQVNVN